MDAAGSLTVHADLLRAGAARLRAAGVGTPRLDAEVLLAHVLGTNRAGLYARLHAASSDDVAARLAAAIDRRARREPVAYITGVQEFWSLPFAVSPAVLIPRPETELLVEIVCRLSREGAEVRRCGGESACGPRDRQHLRTSARPHLRTTISSICDVGTGSGCIAVALARELATARVVATDVSLGALAVGARNAARHGVAERVAFIGGDLFDALDPDLLFDVIVSNPPYLSSADCRAPELDFEPPTALAGGADGLAHIRRLIESAPARLRPGGWLVMELGSGQDAAVRRLASAAGLAQVDVEPDLAGIPRALVARRAGRSG